MSALTSLLNSSAVVQITFSINKIEPNIQVYHQLQK